MKRFIDENRGVYGVEPICKVLPIAPSTYYSHAVRKENPDKQPVRAQRDARLRVAIREVWEENHHVYGARKVWRQLQRDAVEVARCTVERLMRQMGICGVVRGKPAKTTVRDLALPCPADRVNRQFRAPRPNALWVADFTSPRRRDRAARSPGRRCRRRRSCSACPRRRSPAYRSPYTSSSRSCRPDGPPASRGPCRRRSSASPC